MSLFLAVLVLVASALQPLVHASDSQRLTTAETTFPLPLTADTATQENGDPPTLSPVMTTLVYPTNGIEPDLPWVMMFNGANCYSQDYSSLTHQLASRGYLAVVATQAHPQKVELPGMAPSCPKDSLVMITASLLNDVHSVLSSLTATGDHAAVPSINNKARSAIMPLNVDQIVLFAHSLGGVTAINMLTGNCAGGDKPGCGNYTAITDRDGRNALRGVFAYEGNAPGKSSVTVPDGAFLTYMAGQYGTEGPQQHFEDTKGDLVNYIGLKKGNHYAITDWNPDTAPHQKAPCAINVPHDDPKFTTTHEEQEERINFVAAVTDAIIRAQILGQRDAASFLQHEVPHSPLIQRVNIADKSVHQPAVSQAR